MHNYALGNYDTVIINSVLMLQRKLLTVEPIESESAIERQSVQDAGCGIVTATWMKVFEMVLR